MIDLLSLVLTLRPEGNASPENQTKKWWGRAAHELLLRVSGAADPVLAKALHDDSGIRPFSASTLIGRFLNGQPDSQYTYSLRLTALHHELAAILLDAVQNGLLAPGSVIELDHQPFRVEAATWEGESHPWAGATNYQELTASLFLAQDPPPRRLNIQFASPTTFKSHGLLIPVPLPKLLFGSLLERWNRFAPVTFPQEAMEYASQCVVIGQYRLSSRAVPVKNSGIRVGGVGEVTYLTLNYDRYWMSLMGVLSAYALYAGAGAATSMGLGQCRRLPDEQDGDRPIVEEDV